MKKQDIIEAKGTVTELLRDTHFNVSLENGHLVRANASGKMRKMRIRIAIGDSVLMEISKYDTKKGRIIHRYNVSGNTT